MSSPILSVKNLKKRYDKIEAVRGVNLDIPSGICFGLLGPNGAGKTTTIEMMEGISKPTEGEILYKGRPIDRQYSREIGIQFQNTSLQDFLTVKESILLFQQFYENTLSVEEVVEACSLQEILDRDNRKLSGGQRQRLLLAIALINDPEILFLDEPTTGLDPQARRNFWDLIKGIKARGKTILLTTHYMDEAQQLCDEIAIMDKGLVIEQDTSKSLLERHFEGVLIRLPKHSGLEAIELTDVNLVDQGDAWEFITPNVEHSIQQLISKGVSLQGLHVQAPNLEDLFLKLTGHSLRA